MHPLENPTLTQIIALAAFRYRSLLAETLEDDAKENRRLADVNSPWLETHAEYCETAAKAARNGATAKDWAAMPLGVQIVAASAAAKLQSIPYSVVANALLS